MDAIISTSDLKKAPSRYLKLARNSGEPVVITEHGRAAGVLLDHETYRGLLATIEEMRSPDGRSLLKQAQNESGTGNRISHQEIVKNFLKRKSETNG
jgi:prevent-host-death family protein